MEKPMTLLRMTQGFEALDELLPRPMTLIVGGGGAMLLAHGFPLATADIDAIPKGFETHELDSFISRIAKKLGLPADWLNPWFSSFTHVLAEDYQDRLITAFTGRRLTVRALGKEDLLLMKCFAHRKKDVPHARALVRAGANLEMVYERIDELAKRKIPNTRAAADFLDEIVDMENG